MERVNQLPTNSRDRLIEINGLAALPVLLTAAEAEARLEGSPLYRKREADYQMAHQEAIMRALWYTSAEDDITPSPLVVGGASRLN